MSAVGDGLLTVTTAGTRRALNAGTFTAVPTSVNWVVVTALSTNTNPVTVGGPAVVGAAATRRGIGLGAGVSTPRLDVDDLGKVFVDSVTNGEGVSFVFGYNG